MGTDLRISREFEKNPSGSQTDVPPSWTSAVNAQVSQGGESRSGSTSGTRSTQVAQAVLTRPGDCTYARHDELQREVKQACDQDRRCTTLDSSKIIQDKIDQNGKCIAARVRMNATCYRGGDQGHRDAVEQAENALQNCYEKLAAARKRESAASPADEKNEAPASSRGFWKTMEDLTGLTGAALVLYIIISEGSRAFPLRNAVPVL
jgi:hypothetical protein